MTVPPYQRCSHLLSHASGPSCRAGRVVHTAASRLATAFVALIALLCSQVTMWARSADSGGAIVTYSTGGGRKMRPNTPTA